MNRETLQAAYLSFELEAICGKLDNLSTLEVSFPLVGEAVDCSEAIVGIVPPSAWRSGPNRRRIASYKPRGDTMKSEFAELYIEIRKFMRCRLARQSYIMRDVDGVPLTSINGALDQLKNDFSATTPTGLKPGVQAAYLLTSLMGDDKNIPIFDNSDAELSRNDIDAEQQEAYCSFRSREKLMGVAFPHGLLSPHVLWAPSAELQTVTGDGYHIYKLSGSQQEIEEARCAVAVLLGNQDDRHAGSTFPLPIGTWRLSPSTAEKIEFDEPLRVSDASHFVRRLKGV